ncbi:DUF6790 family protein [Candidatus Protochlamydia phocaeensis]|uniref:DUF6790 family protein n=1 Tax=Candidatus Protochlamydia phocaeensis TaxID=1414722 RepID=UPI00083854AC|nr:DUF6790 family protein [Candidatus Protochlamydia phocaeensis]
MYYFLSLYGLGAIAFIIHLFKLPSHQWTKDRIIELLLLYELVFYVGVTSLVAFIGLTFMDDVAAQLLQWPMCPFQQELGNVNLAFGVLGIMCIWFRRSFWIATVVGFSIWIFGDAIHHFYDAYARHNYSEGNLGILVYTDLLVPILLCITLYFYVKSKRKELDLEQAGKI